MDHLWMTISLLKILNRKKREIEMMMSPIWGLNHHKDTEGNEQEDFEQEDDPESAKTNSADTPEKQVIQDEMALQPQATRNARGRVIRPPARFKDFVKNWGCSMI